MSLQSSVPEPPPQKGEKYVFPILEGMLINSHIAGSRDFLTLVRQRRQYGINKYKTELMTFNGRNAIEDAKQEIGDCAAYIIQAKLEGRSDEEINKLKQMVDILSLILEVAA